MCIDDSSMMEFYVSHLILSNIQIYNKKGYIAFDHSNVFKTSFLNKVYANRLRHSLFSIFKDRKQSSDYVF